MFRYLSQKTRLLREMKNTEAMRVRQEAYGAASSIAFVTLTEAGEIDGVTAAEHTELFSPWAQNVTYAAGSVRAYEGSLYRCVQAHTSQDAWTPDKIPALWTKIGDPAAEFPEWSQPIGAHDAYAKGDKVSYEARHWQSAADGNVWRPGVYGWEEITES